MRRIPSLLAALAFALVALAPTAQAQCRITGAPLVGDELANYCGGGGSAYRWEGPNGFAATTRCIAITQPGEYRLFAFDSDTGLWFGPCTVTVEADTIGPPPPPPAPDSSMNCPRAAWQYARACRANVRSKAIMSPKQLVAISTKVDERAELFGWADAPSGFCATMRMPASSDLRGRAVRQFAGVLANLAATEMKLVPADGREVHLRENTVLAADGARGMLLRDWVANTDAELMSLASALPSDRTARRAYHRIRRVGWMINHGMGIGEVCARGVSISAGERDDDESMAMALANDEEASGIVMESASPNPFRGQTRIAYTLEQSGDVELSVLDLSGRMVKTLARGTQSAGRHELSWDGRTDAGQSLPAGAYFVHGRVGEQRVQGRIVMIR